MDRKGQGLYPGYDVLALQDEWDAVTRQIVNKRLGPFQYKVCSHWEQTMIKTLAEHLTYDCRDEVLTWITAHVDQQLASPTGEAQRKPNTPPKRADSRGPKDVGRLVKEPIWPGLSPTGTGSAISDHQFLADR